MKEAMGKGKAAGMVILFFALLRPETKPPMWFVALLGLALYECILRAFRIHAEIKRDKRIAQNVAFRKRDGEALDRERFNPIKEVV